VRALVACVTVTAVLCAASGGIAATQVQTHPDGDIKFRLDGRTLTVTLLEKAGLGLRKQLYGNVIRAACGTGRWARPEGTVVHRIQTWPKGRSSLRYRFKRDISRRVRWCALEERGGIDITSVRFKRRT
jgi:hypothetical protein